MPIKPPELGPDYMQKLQRYLKTVQCIGTHALAHPGVELRLATPRGILTINSKFEPHPPRMAGLSADAYFVDELVDVTTQSLHDMVTECAARIGTKAGA